MEVNEKVLLILVKKSLDFPIPFCYIVVPTFIYINVKEANSEIQVIDSLFIKKRKFKCDFE